jgi:hypothetical protein
VTDLEPFFGSWFMLDDEDGLPQPGSSYAMPKRNGLVVLVRMGDYFKTAALTSCFVPMMQHDAVHILKRRSKRFRQAWERSLPSADGV